MKTFFARLFRSNERTPQAPGWSFRPNQSVGIASRLCIGPDRRKVMNMKREPIPESDAETDLTGWFMFSGAESEKFMADPSNFVRVSLPAFIRDDPSLAAVVDLPVDTEVVRNEKDMIWRRVIDDKVLDSRGGIIAELRKQD